MAVRQACDGVAGTSAALDLHNNFALPEGNAMCGQVISSGVDQAEGTGVNPGLVISLPCAGEME